MEAPRTKTKALLVALKNGEIRLYNGKHLVYTLEIGKETQGMCYGTFGREEGSLVISLKSGGLMVKMLARTANLEADGSETAGKPPAERDQSVEMHRIFQRDLCRLRLSTARAYVKLLHTQHATSGVKSALLRGQSLSLSAAVRGMGPEFQIRAQLSTESQEPLRDLLVFCEANKAIYTFTTECSTFVPLLVPGYGLVLPFDVLALQPPQADTIRISVLSAESEGGRALVSALVQMPVSEL